jgi:hypothetical protein
MTPEKDTTITETRNPRGDESAPIKQEYGAVRNREIVKKGKRAFQISRNENYSRDQKDIKVNLGVSKGRQIFNPGEKQGRANGNQVCRDERNLQRTKDSKVPSFKKMDERCGAQEKGEDDYSEKQQPLDSLNELSLFLVQSSPAAAF